MAGTIAALSAIPAAGEEKQKFPRIEGAIPIEIQNDWNFDSDDAGSRYNQLFTTTEPQVTVWIAPGFSLFVHGVLQPVTDPEPREDRFFEDHGLFLEDLFLNYEAGRYAFKGGKFTPNFGRGWDETPGVYGTDFAEGYEFSERIGIEGSAAFEHPDAGKHRFSASTFFLDTSVLAHSTPKSRGTTGLADGGVSNTEDFSSYALSLDGEDVAGFKGLRYHAAFIRQAKGTGDTADETGVALAITQNFTLPADVTLTPFFEFVHFDDAGGVDQQDRDFFTVAARFGWKNWNLSLAYTDRDTQNPDGTQTQDFLFQTSIGYEFDFGLAVDVGWRIANESSIETQTLGLLLAYKLEF